MEIVTADGQVRTASASENADLFWAVRGAGSNFGVITSLEATWEDPQATDQNIAWARESLAMMQDFSNGGSYLNFPGFGEEKEAMLRASYGSNYDRLVDLKTKYDPGNLFRVNLNIPPRV